MLVAEWALKPSVWTAADLVSAGLVNGKFAEADDAAAYLSSRLGEIQDGTREIVRAYREDASARPGIAAPLIPRDVKRRQIREIKDEIALYPRNPVLHVELARAYVSLGQGVQARRAFEIALALAPTNRYVLRSAVRFFVFEGEAERAWSAVKQAPKDDLWLLASRVAVADLLGMPLESGRRLRNIVEDADPSQVSELAAAVATVELGHGGNKMAKSLFKKGSRDPTDNTVAQIRWAHETSGIPFDKALLRNDLTFEARTGQDVEERNWSSAVHNASSWLGDEPFSGRAAGTGGFIAAEMLQDYPLAEHLCSSGLTVNSNDPVLLNNRAFARACQGKFDGAAADLESANSRTLELSDRICLEATAGCLEYRKGNIARGSHRYEKSIMEAILHDRKMFAQRAYIHWFHEEARAGYYVSKEEAQRIKAYFERDGKIDSETREIYRVYAQEFVGSGEPIMPGSAIEGALDLLPA